jgi:hypothetical protein
MASSGMLRRVALVRADVSEERSASFIRVTRIGELETTLDITRNRRKLGRNTSVHRLHCSYFTDSCYSDEGGTMFLQNVGSYKSHMT